jgi:hypothetical protein
VSNITNVSKTNPRSNINRNTTINNNNNNNNNEKVNIPVTGRGGP